MSQDLIYRAVLALSLLVAAVAVVFFFIGIADGSVSSFNMGIWMLLLGGVGGVLGVGLSLRARQKTRLAISVLLLTAVPGLLGLLFLLLVLVLQPRWN